MFGLKVIKEHNYVGLVEDLKRERELSEHLAAEIEALKNENASLKDELESLKKKEKVNLITDVAEAPLAVEKPAKKVIRKTSSGKTTRKGVIKKAENEKSQE